MVELKEILSKYNYRFANEKELQRGVATALTIAQIPFSRELRLSPGDIPDFLLADGTVIEVKCKGKTTDTWAQLDRYAMHRDVTNVVLLTTMVQHMGGPVELHGKPISYIHITQ